MVGQLVKAGAQYGVVVHTGPWPYLASGWNSPPESLWAIWCYTEQAAADAYLQAKSHQLTPVSQGGKLTYSTQPAAIIGGTVGQKEPIYDRTYTKKNRVLRIC